MKSLDGKMTKKFSPYYPVITSSFITSYLEAKKDRKELHIF